MKFNSTKLRNRFIRSNSSLDHVWGMSYPPNLGPFHSSQGGWVCLRHTACPSGGSMIKVWAPKPNQVGGLISSDWIPRHFFSDEKSFWIKKRIGSIFFYCKNKHLGLFLANLFAIFQNKNLITNSKNVGPKEPISGLDFALELIFLYIR